MPEAAPAGAAEAEPGGAARFCASLLWVLSFPFRLVWHAVAIYLLPCVGAYGESLLWKLCCFVCISCGWRFEVRRPSPPGCSPLLRSLGPALPQQLQPSPGGRWGRRASCAAPRISPDRHPRRTRSSLRAPRASARGTARPRQ